jgi:hypothetical protein
LEVPIPQPKRANPPNIPNDLPTWLLLALKTVTGREVSCRSDLPFLQKLKDTLPMVSRDATLYHIPSSWCANSMANDKVHIHNKNGTVFAVDSKLKVIYATCSTGSHKITENNSKCIKVVNMYNEGIAGKCVHWVMADEEMMALLVKTG